MSNISFEAQYRRDEEFGLLEPVRQRVSEFLIQTGKTNAELSRILGKDPSVVSRYISQDVTPPLIVIRRICSTFKVSADYLLGLAQK